MKSILLAVFLFVIGTAQAKDVQRLAGEPEAYVEDGMCTIQGAIAVRSRVRNPLLSGNRTERFQVTRDGGVAKAPIELVNIDTGEIVRSTTDDHGFYEVSIPYAGRAVYQERGTERGRGWTQPKVICQGSSVNVGAIEALGGA